MKIFTLTGVGDTGKTTTLNLLFDKLNFYPIEHLEVKQSRKSDKKDFKATFLLNGVTVGLGSSGDTRSEIEKNFDFFESHLCSVCLCNVRTKGGTQAYLEERIAIGDMVDQTEKTVNKQKQNEANERDAEILLRKLLTELHVI